MKTEHIVDDTRRTNSSKLEKLKSAFRTINKDSDSPITQEELVKFLDSNLTDGRKFDRQLANKIFESMDFDRDNAISVDEFIKRFLGIEEELNESVKEFQRNYVKEKDNNMKLQKLMKDNMKEKLNSEGISQNAKVLIEISEVEFFQKLQGMISVRISFRDEMQETETVKGLSEKMVLNSKFEFLVYSRRDEFTFELLAYDSEGKSLVVGSIKFSLTSITKQDEYDLELIIPDEADEKIISASIKAKIRFIWSHFELYQESIAKSEKILSNLQGKIDKSLSYLEQLNEPLRMFNVLSSVKSKEEVSTNSDHIIIKQKGKSGKVQGGIAGIPLSLPYSQYEVAEKVENFVKTSLNKPNLSWMFMIKACSFSLLLLALLSSFTRCEFVDLLLVFIILVKLNTNFESDIEGSLTLFLNLSLILVSYETIWLLLSSPYGQLDKQSSLGVLVLIFSVVSIILKLGLIISSWIQLVKMRENNKLHSNQISTNYLTNENK